MVALLVFIMATLEIGPFGGNVFILKNDTLIKKKLSKVCSCQIIVLLQKMTKS